jgi:hypothetical protein
MKLSHVPANVIIKGTKIPERKFYFRVSARQVKSIQPFNGQKLYDVKDWNSKNEDYTLVQEK